MAVWGGGSTDTLAPPGKFTPRALQCFTRWALVEHACVGLCINRGLRSTAHITGRPRVPRNRVCGHDRQPLPLATAGGLKNDPMMSPNAAPRRALLWSLVSAALFAWAAAHSVNVTFDGNIYGGSRVGVPRVPKHQLRAATDPSLKRRRAPVPPFLLTSLRPPDPAHRGVHGGGRPRHFGGQPDGGPLLVSNSKRRGGECCRSLHMQARGCWGCPRNARPALGARARVARHGGRKRDCGCRASQPPCAMRPAPRRVRILAVPLRATDG